jgi:exodeoxyribonuclease VII small subunit
MPKKDLSLDAGLAKLEELVKEFESEKLDLEKAIPRFKEGVELGRKLKLKLDKLENEIKELRLDSAS